jgi:hypothetical protein
MRQIVRVNTPRTPELVTALTQKGIDARGSVVGEPPTRDLPEESFIAEVEAVDELDAVARLREVLEYRRAGRAGAPGTGGRPPVAIQPARAAGHLGASCVEM